MKPIKSECYALVQQIVTKRDKLCKGPGCMNISTSGHHLFKRDNMGTAFNTRYVIGLCNTCHGWAQRNPSKARQWAIYLLGEDEYLAGQRLAKSVVKYVDLEKIRDGLKNELDRLCG
jgi:hypothetical protein